MNREIILNTKSEMYDNCENVEQLFDNFYIPLLQKYNISQNIIKQLKEKLNFYTLEYGTKVNMQELDKKQLIDMLVASFSREHNLIHNWNKLEEIIKQNIECVEWTDLTEDYLLALEDVLSKMQEIGGSNE